MTVGLSILVAALGGLIGLAAPAASAPARRLGTLVAFLAAATCAALAVAMPIGDAIGLGGVRLTATPAVRLAELGWAAGLIGLGLIGAALRIRSVVATGLVALAAGLAALAVDLPAVAFGALACGGAAAVLAPAALRAADPGRRLVTIPGTAAPVAAAAALATLGSAVLGIGLVAWGRSPVGAAASGAVVAVQDVAFQSAVGLAVLAMAALVAVRAAAIPAHLWAARLVAALSPIAVPSALGWGSAAFAVVGVTWAEATLGAAGTTLDDLDHWLVVVVAVVGLGLGTLAALLHDDLEHVLGYWLIGAGGLTLLAFAAPSAGIVPAVADWTLGLATLATGFAAWIVVVRWAFGSDRVGSLGGWARRSPALVVALLLLLAGGIGLPGTALWEARATVGSAALPGLGGTLVAGLAGVASLLVFGRILVAGLSRPAGDVAATPRERLGLLVLAPSGWTGGGTGWWLRRASAAIRANRALALDLVVVALCGLGVALSASGTAAIGG